MAQLRISAVAAGVYAVWEGEALIYCGMSGRKFENVVASVKAKFGLVTRLASHASGRLSGDQFCVYVANRLVIPSLKPEQLAEFATGELNLDSLTKSYINERLEYQFAFVHRARRLTLLKSDAVKVSPSVLESDAVKVSPSALIRRLRLVGCYFRPFAFTPLTRSLIALDVTWSIVIDIIDNTFSVCLETVVYHMSIVREKVLANASSVSSLYCNSPCARCCPSGSLSGFRSLSRTPINHRTLWSSHTAQV